MKYYFAITGISLIAGAVYLFWRRFVVIRKGAISVGIIESYQTRVSDDSTFYLPVITFFDEGKGQYQFTSVAGYGYKKLPEGSSVSVRYHPDKPEIAYINSFLHIWAGPLAMALMGAAGLSVLWLE